MPEVNLKDIAIVLAVWGMLTLAWWCESGHMTAWLKERSRRRTRAAARRVRRNPVGAPAWLQPRPGGSGGRTGA
ncbi:hypothetical protein AB0M95_27005 [Sphaerisporangium sp. NPDC051017]|uniref:hypothetical protein n=1 Tax=Sphaerisporangium sp. NPDC051017 TaxID=3154636 RepID=UPI00343ADFE6